MAQSIYDEIKKNADDEKSKICLKTIEYITKIMSNFAKYGSVLCLHYLYGMMLMFKYELFIIN